MPDGKDADGGKTNRGFPPEEQELLRRSHLRVVDADACRSRIGGVRVSDACFEEDQGDG